MLRLSGVSVSVVLLSGMLAAPVLGQTTHAISNYGITVGVNANWGGAITQLDFPVGKSTRVKTVDNTNGPGRQVEVSLYTYGSHSDDCWPVVGACEINPECPWKWNPVQAGNACGRGSGAVVTLHTPTRIVTLTWPMQWSPAWGGSSDVRLSQDVEIIGPHLVRVTHTITNFGTYAFGSEHELPVAYLDSSFTKGVYYEGLRPGTNDPALTLRDFASGRKRLSVTTTEEWIGFAAMPSTRPCPLMECPAVLLHIPQKTSGWNIGRVEDGVAMLQAWREFVVNPGATQEVTAYIAVGSLAEARAAVHPAVLPGNMRRNFGIRNCALQNQPGPVPQPSAASCYNHCAASAARACEWNQESGDCWAFFGATCSAQPGYAGWWAAVMNRASLAATPTTTLRANSAVRDCSGVSSLPPVFQPSASTCSGYCTYNGATACEWEQSSGDCWAVFGEGCAIQSGYGGWWAGVFAGAGEANTAGLLSLGRPAVPSSRAPSGEPAKTAASKPRGTSSQK